MKPLQLLAAFILGACMGLHRTTPTNWGKTQPAATNVGAQLARIQLAEPSDVAVYLYGWDTPNHTNNVLGRYDVTYGSGGTSTTDRIECPARGLVLHYVAQQLEVASVSNQSPPLQSLSKAHIGRGRPVAKRIVTSFAAAIAGGLSPVLTIPQWTTSVRFLGQFNTSVPAPFPLATDAIVQVANANDPTFGSPQGYLIASLFDGYVPLGQASGFIRVVGGALSNVSVCAQIDGIQ